MKKKMAKQNQKNSKGGANQPVVVGTGKFIKHFLTKTL